MDNAVYADIVFDIPLNQRFTYKVPTELQAAARPGVRITTRFGRMRKTGFLLALHETPPPDIKLKNIEDILDPTPVFSPELLRLASWLAEYYLCGTGEVLKAMLPAGMVLKATRTVRLSVKGREQATLGVDRQHARERAIIDILVQRSRITVPALKKKLGFRGLEYRLRLLRDAGLVEMDGEISGRALPIQLRKYVRLTRESAALAAGVRTGAHRQQRILEYLHEIGGSAALRDLMQATGASTGAVASLVRLGVLEQYTRRIERDYYGDLKVTPAPRLVLNREQDEAVRTICAAIDSGAPKTFLIHGVTGSGKTQVYIESIRHSLRNGAGAIVLVPEIALTPQTVRRFRAEFQDKVAVLHSRMSAGERFDAWKRIGDGRADVVVGARSAVFAPMPRLGLLVVDEEHEGSYKQHEHTPRYHARDIAVMRGHLGKAVVLLGSATPSMESYHNAQRGKYQLIEMLSRIDDVPMPEVRLVDMARERRARVERGETVLSRLLVEKITEKLERDEQVIILQNRRGFATAVRCEDCGHVEMCEDCSISLSYHFLGLQMRCHYCDRSQPAPMVCPKCASATIKYKGIGTQRVERHMTRLFPDARIARMDHDTTRGKRTHDRILQRFGAREYDILLGTQMIAKGLDFPNVTLVGVIMADTGLYLPDFRAAERTFQLLTQVAGRAGRKEKTGEVIIQTFSPSHFSLACARQHDFRRFYDFESADRQALRYPPYGRLVLLQLKHIDEDKGWRATETLAGLLSRPDNPFDILGPGPAPLSRIQKYFRFQILLKNDRQRDPAGTLMRKAVLRAVAAYREQTRYRQVKLTVDVDPVSIL